MPDTSVTISVRTSRSANPRRQTPENGAAIGGSAQLGVVDRHCAAPAIYYCDRVPEQNDLDAAVALGFNAIGIPHLVNESLQRLAPMVVEASVNIAMDLDITVLGYSNEVVNQHPEWFTHSTEGPRFVYLSELDPAVDYWDEQIAALQLSSIQAFRCLNVGGVLPAIWTRLITAAKQRNPQTAFYAWTIGLSSELIASFEDCGFDFVFSSSCWWDFKSGWLDDDVRRLAIVAPPIALVTPPNAAWPSRLSHRRRAIDLAAFYGAGWLMPAGFQYLEEDDLSGRVIYLNHLRRDAASMLLHANARLISSVGSRIAVLNRADRLVLLVNSSADEKSIFSLSDVAGKLTGRLASITGEALPQDPFELAPAQTEILTVSPVPPVTGAGSAAPDCEAPRIAIESITPQVDHGEFPVRRVVGERVTVEADLIADGHDKIAADLIWRCLDEEVWRHTPMKLLTNDRWRGDFPVDRLGRYLYAIVSWKDVYATFVDELSKKFNAGISTRLEIEEGLVLLRDAAANGAEAERETLGAVLRSLNGTDEDTKRRTLLSPDLSEKMRAVAIRKFTSCSHNIIVDAERIGARFANWYEIFPRSQSGDGVRHGTFRDVIGQLPRVAAMGFDVLYFPPIHPIGRINRKGKNNTLTPSESDPGSPYAIGSDDGGHDKIHPELGGFDDFAALLKEAAKYGIEIALDFAIQCAPDHPWLSQHKDWFDWRPDGSIRYAENPPKKYEDIVNVDFYAAGAKPGLWQALRDVVQFWIDQGIRLFRVDNPHTKPLPFWEWLINDIRSRHPDTVFLAEAFTRPKVMYRLAKIGFSQSYTYFTWRNTKAELTAYLTELNETSPKDFFRPHFFVNTPDINPIFLHNSGRAGFLIRAALAATLSGLWGSITGLNFVTRHR